MRVSEMSTYVLLCIVRGSEPVPYHTSMPEVITELARRIDEFRESQKAAAEDAEAQRRQGESNVSDRHIGG
jgi:hypothetical protein